MCPRTDSWIILLFWFWISGTLHTETQIPAIKFIVSWAFTVEALLWVTSAVLAWLLCYILLIRSYWRSGLGRHYPTWSTLFWRLWVMMGDLMLLMGSPLLWAVIFSYILYRRFFVLYFWHLIMNVIESFFFSHIFGGAKCLLYLDVVVLEWELFPTGSRIWNIGSPVGVTREFMNLLQSAAFREELRHWRQALRVHSLDALQFLLSASFMWMDMLSLSFLPWLSAAMPFKSLWPFPLEP